MRTTLGNRRPQAEGVDHHDILCYRLRWRTWLTGPGDNQAVRLSIRLPDGVDPKTALGLASAPKVPRGSIVVPFWDYLIGFLIRAPKRNYYGAYGYRQSPWKRSKTN